MTARATSTNNNSLAEAWRGLRRVLLPLTGIIVARSFMTSALTTFLPTLLASEGATLWFASGSLSIFELAGALGALTSGTFSDRLGRRRVLFFVMFTSPLAMLLFLAVSGWLSVPVLVVLGFLTLSTSPVMMAMIQEQGRDYPATANGLYMGIGFLVRAAVVIAVGAVADHWGLRTAFEWSAILGLLGLPFVWLLPD